MYVKSYASFAVALLLLLFSCQEEKVIPKHGSVISNTDSKEVSPDLAQKVALKFIASKIFLGKSKEEKTGRAEGFENKFISKIIPLKGNTEKVALYAINFFPSGYVIVPATKKETPILAFSEHGYFDKKNIPTGLQDWVNQRSKIVAFLDTARIIENANQLWTNYSAPAIEDEIIINKSVMIGRKSPLLQTKWGQKDGYNDLIRFRNCSSGQTPTGCVATAIAQIMRYHEHPNNYNWSIMPSKITMRGSSNEVARLMKDVGESVNMQYACGISGAYITDAISALKNTFNYSNYMNHSNFNRGVIILELEASRPVILLGQSISSGNGHVWLCDGYKKIDHIFVHNPNTVYEYETHNYTDVYLHMNWGLNGKNDGWFAHNSPSTVKHKYTFGYKMITNIHP